MPADRRDSRFWLLPALTFIVGLALGGILVGVGITADRNDVEAGAAPTPTPTATSTTPADQSMTVTVPGDCVAAAEHSEEVLGLAREAVAAIGDLDARRLQGIVSEMRALEPQVSESASRCREAAGENATS